MVVDDMAIMPPRNIQSILLHEKACPVAIPSIIIEKTMMMAEMKGEMPIFRIFLMEKSNPSEKSRNMTPISAHVWMFPLSITDMVSGIWGDTMKPATMYPSTKGWRNFLKMRVTMLATIRIKARSLTSSGSDANGV